MTDKNVLLSWPPEIMNFITFKHYLLERCVSAFERQTEKRYKQVKIFRSFVLWSSPPSPARLYGIWQLKTPIVSAPVERVWATPIFVSTTKWKRVISEIKIEWALILWSCSPTFSHLKTENIADLSIVRTRLSDKNCSLSDKLKKL